MEQTFYELVRDRMEALEEDPGFRLELMRASRADAIRRHEQWPQYEGYFDGPEWGLYLMKRTVRYKGGHHLVEDRFYMARPSRELGPTGRRTLTVWNPQGGWMQQCFASDAREVIPRKMAPGDDEGVTGYWP